MKVFMVGGTGLLGNEGAREMIRRGHEVSSIALPPIPQGALLPPEMTVAFGNYLELSDEEIRTHMRGCEGFIFAAGVDERIEGPPPIYDMFSKYNIVPLKRLLTIAKACGVRHFVLCGSYFAYFNRAWPEKKLAEHHPYIRSRVDQAAMALSFADENFDVAVLELPYIFGAQPGRKPVWVFLVEQIRGMKGATLYPKGGTTMLTVRQVGQCMAGALERNRGGRNYPVGWDNLTWREMLAIVHKHMGIPERKIITIPDWMFRLGCRDIVRKQREAGHEGGLDMVAFTQVMCANAFIDKATIEQELGVQPDDIDAAIGESIRLCTDILDGRTQVIGMKGENKPKTRVFLTGATGGMGFASLQELLKDPEHLEVVTLARPSEKNRRLLAPYMGREGLTIHWGDLVNFKDVEPCVAEADIVLHVGAFVSPEADYHPEKAMQINYGSTLNILEAIRTQNRTETVKLVYIGTVAQTGDRMPPIHWGRVGDPMKPSVYDYYAVSKVASERAVIESGLKYWVSLRQTGILAEKMLKIEDAIMFHNCLDNVLEYVTEHDSAVLMRNVCGEVPESFWGHIYNIGGGSSCRTSCHDMFVQLYGRIGLKDLSLAMDANWFATRNFHGQYYLDSDKLEEILHFRREGMDDFYRLYEKILGSTVPISRFICRLPGGQKLIGGAMRKKFLALTRTEHGTVRFVENDMKDQIAAYFISREEWEKIPPLNGMKHFEDWDTKVVLDHGYDESKPEEELSLTDLKGAAAFRGGVCTSESMKVGDWRTKHSFTCAFGHSFDASPRLVLEGGHWCPECERKSWNYPEIAKRNPFFAQVWYPLHERDEPSLEVPKAVSDLDVAMPASISGKN